MIYFVPSVTSQNQRLVHADVLTKVKNIQRQTVQSSIPDLETVILFFTGITEVGRAFTLFTGSVQQLVVNVRTYDLTA
jgi:membrane protein YqaA with SNARE-associated domain